MNSWPAFLFGMTGRVSQRAYIVAGAALMALKYLGDALLFYLGAHTFFTPLQYLNPVAAVRLGEVPLPGWVVFSMVVWAMPFLWIGLSLSLRRALDAGLGPSAALLFLLPIVNLGVIAWLSSKPSLAEGQSTRDARAVAETRLKITSLMVGAGLSLVLTALCSQVVGGYGAALFVGTPVLVGFVTGWLANRHETRGLMSTLGLASSVIALSAVGLLLFALEGLVCLVFMLPLALPLAWIGALLGRAWASRVTPPQVAVMLLTLPLIMGAEQHGRARAPLRAVTTEVTIDAPPHVVWENVIGFSELPAPHELIFMAGIAYPLRAEIRGRGVGAVRHCVFSTGPFVEPITNWAPPHRLAFDVTSQPPGMKEASLFSHVYAPHLDGYPRSERGEFRLIATATGGTRLIGTTWYRIAMFPQLYWAPISDALIHAIHGRVLEHIKDLSTH